MTCFAPPTVLDFRGVKSFLAVQNTLENKNRYLISFKSALVKVVFSRNQIMDLKMLFFSSSIQTGLKSRNFFEPEEVGQGSQLEKSASQLEKSAKEQHPPYLSWRVQRTHC